MLSLFQVYFIALFVLHVLQCVVTAGLLMHLSKEGRGRMISVDPRIGALGASGSGGRRSFRRTAGGASGVVRWIDLGGAWVWCGFEGWAGVAWPAWFIIR